MSALLLPFEPSEYDARIGKTRRAMQARGIELLIVSDPSNMAWLTGYDGWSFYVHQCVLLALDGDPVWFGRGQDANGAKRTTFLGNADIQGYPDHYVQSTERHPMDYLADAVIRARGWDGLSVGVEMDNYYFSAACLASLQRHLPNARFHDATGLVNWQRAVKSSREIEYIRRAARIVEAMHAQILELVEPGLPKNRLIAEIYRTGINGADGFGGDYPAIVPLAPSGADASAAHLTWDERPFKRDEGTFFEIAGCYRRYHCPLSRTVYLGSPPQKFLDTEKAVLEGIDAALDAARPGNSCESVEAAWRQVIARYGIEKESRCGYSIGLSYPPDWGERTMSLRPGDRTLLEEGMCFHLIPAIWQDDWGLEITESFQVTANGAEPFCQYPRRLLVKDWGVLRPSPIRPSVDYDRDGVQHGFLRLPYSRDDSAWGAVMIPITVIRNGLGPTALITGGNRGNEYEGPIALLKLASALQPEQVSGRVIIVPAMNYLAFRVARRTSPADARNMNRIFPGSPDGTVTEKIADYFQRCLLPLADVVLDFHSGGKTLDFLPMAAVHVLPDKEQQARCVAAMEAFGAPYGATLLEIDSAGMYDTAAEAMGKLFVSTELGGGGTSSARSVRIADRGLRNFLIHTGIVQGKIERPPTVRLDMPGDECFVTSESDGVVEMYKDLGEAVAAGEPIAAIHPIHRTGLAPLVYRANITGILMARHFPGLIQPGDCLAVVAVPLD